MIHVKRLAAAATLAVPLALTAVPAQAAPSPNNHLLDITRVTSTSVIARTSCFSDPPQTVFVTFAGQSSSGFVPITCDSTKQIVVIPLDSPLPVGTRVNTTVTVSGDGGEINDFGVFRVQR